MAARAGMALLALTAAWTAPAAGEEADSAGMPSVEFVGPQGERVVADAAWFDALPQVEREIRFQTSQGPAGGVFGGVDLWEALERAGMIGEGGGHPYLRQSIVATAGDGYEILYSLGEIAPDFGAGGIMIAFEEDGEPLAADRSPRIVVPGDTRGARNLYDVERITVR